MLSGGALHAENFRRMDVLKRSIPEICFSFWNEQYPYGPVAQLGAHHIRIVGVVGSNPIRSTRKQKTPRRKAAVFFFAEKSGESC